MRSTWQATWQAHMNNNNNNHRHRCVDCSDLVVFRAFDDSLALSSHTTVLSEVSYPMPAKERTKTAHSPSNDTCQQKSSPPFISPLPSRAPTPRINRRLLPRRPKRCNAAACARYRLRKKGTLVKEMRSLHTADARRKLTTFLSTLILPTCMYC